MRKEIIISEANDMAVVFEDGQAVEFFLRSGDQLVGDIIWGQVEAVVPGIEAAFVNIGQERNGFIHVADLPSAQTPRRQAAPKKPSIRVKERILVQIAKAPTGTKGARLTGRLTIPGRFLVLVPHDNRVSISRRIVESAERDRLRRLTLKLKDPGHGVIVRTEAIGRSEEDLRQDIEELIEIWADILHQVQIVRPPCLLHRDSDLIHRVLRDAITADVTKVVVDTQSGFQKAREILKGWMPELARNVIQHRGPSSILDRYRIREELEAAISPKVWLPSGGYLVIEHTEALTVIDVNSGRLTQSKSLADTVLRTNLEAAAEVARQLRLRDIGGIIVIDFISMDTDSDRKKVLSAFKEALRTDKSRPQVTDFSEHGLIEVSRRRQGQNLLEQLTAPCETCAGTGRIRTSNLLPHDHARVEATQEREPVEETSAIVHDITEEPMATEVVLAEGPATARAVAEGEDDRPRRRRRRRRRRGEGEEGIGGMLTTTRPEDMLPEDEDEEGYLPPVMVPEEVTVAAGRRGRRPAVAVEEVALFDEEPARRETPARREASARREAPAHQEAPTMPLVEEVSLDFGAPSSAGGREPREPRGGRDRNRRVERRDHEDVRDHGREPRRGAPRTERPAPAPVAAEAFEVSAPAPRTRRVERRGEAAPAAVPTPAPAPAATRPARPAPAPAPARPAAAAAPAKSNVIDIERPKFEAPIFEEEVAPTTELPQALEVAAVPGLFTLKKKEAPKPKTTRAKKETPAAEAPAEEAKPKRRATTTRRATKAAEEAPAEAPKKPAAKTTRKKAAEAPAEAAKKPATKAAAKPAAKTTRAKKTAEA